MIARGGVSGCWRLRVNMGSPANSEAWAIYLQGTQEALEVSELEREVDSDLHSGATGMGPDRLSWTSLTHSFLCSFNRDLTKHLLCARPQADRQADGVLAPLEGRGAGVNCEHHCGVRGERDLMSLSFWILQAGACLRGEGAVRARAQGPAMSESASAGQGVGRKGTQLLPFIPRARGSGAGGTRELMAGGLAHAFSL